MRTLGLVIVIVVFVGCPAGVLANCPFGYEDEIFCDDFDTYGVPCGGHPGGPKCTDPATRNDHLLKQTWLADPFPAIGTEMLVSEDNQAWLTSGPFGGRHPCQGDAKCGQVTLRDWVRSSLPLTDPNQIRNMIWLIQNAFPGSDAVVGTDENPLHLDFLVNGLNSAKIHWNNGYVELSLGTDRANTNYFPSPDCSTYCDPPIAFEPMPIICAQGNPLGAMPAGCPDVQTYPPPVRASIAVGVLGMLDTDPCHCVGAHGPYNPHLNVFDGQKWWILRADNPQPTTGEVYPKNGSTPLVPPYPPGLTTPGRFTLNGAINGGKGFNWISLTIKTNTFKVELRTQERSTDGEDYNVTSVMDNIPRAYKYTGPGPTDFSGAFDSMRIGVGMGCELASNTSWTGCAGNTRPLRSRACCAGANIYDDLVLYGGEGASQVGACCLDDGGCVIASSQECANQQGIYRGPNTTCDASTCMGACCVGLECTDTLITECPGAYQGIGTACATTACPCPTPFADVDFDGDVDQDDFAAFQACFTGSGPATVAGPCICFDHHTGADDPDVDEDDYYAFEACASGPDVPADPACE